MSGSDCSDGFTQALQKLQARLRYFLLTDCIYGFTYTTRGSNSMPGAFACWAEKSHCTHS